jgi:virginiamycin B lyase
MRPRALAAIFALFFALSLCALAGGSGDSTYSVREYTLPAGAGDMGAMTVDAPGNVWLIQNEPPTIYKLVRENGTFSRYTLDGFKNAGFTGISVDDAGIVWFADQEGNRFGAYKEADNKTSSFDFPGPMAPSSILRRDNILFIGCKEEVGEYDLRFPEEPLQDHFVYHMDSYLRDIHLDRFNNVWAVEYARNNVSVYWRMYDKSSEFAIPTGDSYPTCLSIDSQGRLWFVESATNKLGMFHTELFNFSEYDMPVIDGEKPIISHVATVGDDVWLTDVNGSRVLRFYPDEGRFAAAQLAGGSAPTFISADSNGTLWIYEASSKKLASLDVTGQFGQATPTPTPGPTATPVPSPSGTPQPTKTPGFLLLIAIAALISAFYISRTGK